MESRKWKYAVWIIYALAALLFFFILYPSHINHPTRDSGVFLYEGAEFLRGSIPYKDMWDHKPPMIIFLNALGLLISHGAMWGGVVLQHLILICSFMLGFAFLKREFGFFPAVFGSFGWALSFIGVFEGGNFTEEYALVCQFLSLYIFVRAQRRGGYRFSEGVWTGILFALSFMLKQNLIGVWLAIGFYLLVKHISAKNWRGLLKDYSAIAIGFLSVIAAIVYYFWSNHALAEFWDVAFRYNFIYSSSTSILQRLRTVVAGAFYVTWFPFLAMGWIYAAGALIKSFRSQTGAPSALSGLAVILFPVEILLTSVSGFRFPHYFIAWLPMTAVLLAYFSNLFFDFLINLKADNQRNLMLRQWLVALFYLILLDKGTVSLKSLYLTEWKKIEEPRWEIVDFLQKRVAPEDPVLVWGRDGHINFLTQTRSPSRFFIQTPLFTKNYTNHKLMSEFINAVRGNPPKYIVDSPNWSQPPLSPEKRAAWREVMGDEIDELSKFYAFIESNYTLDTTIPNWPVYVRKDDL